jgi:hypothetical protein
MAIILNGTTGITTPADTVTGNASVGGDLTVTGAATVGGVAVVAVAPSTAGNVLTSNGSAWTSAAPSGGTTPSAIGQIPFSTNGLTYTPTQKITQGTTVASTSGTSIDFTGIPSWVTRVTVMFNGVSTNGTSRQQIQLGVSGTPETSSYTTMTALVSGTTDNITRFAVISSGFPFSYTTSASSLYSGTVVFTLLGSNSWTCTGTIYDANSPSMNTVSGIKALAGTLNMIRITTVNGTDTFDAGSINILYE